MAGAEEYIFNCLKWAGLNQMKAQYMAAIMDLTVKVKEKNCIENMLNNW